MYTVIELCKLRARVAAHMEYAVKKGWINGYYFWAEHYTKLSRYIANY